LDNSSSNTVDIVGMWEGANPHNWVLRRKIDRWEALQWRESGDTWYLIDIAHTMPALRWHHVALQYDYSDGDLALYYDGVWLNEDSATAFTAHRTTPATDTLQINGPTNNGEFAISDLQIHTALLTSAEIAGACAGNPPTANLAARWLFDGDGVDSSGNGHDLTANGTIDYGFRR
jgi:hypothetical protein